MKLHTKPRFYFPALVISIIIMVFFIPPGCKNYNKEDLYPACDTVQIGYAEDILPIFSANCIPCHSTTNAFGSIILATLEDARIPAENGLLLKAVTHDPGVVPMPKGGGQLSDCEISKISRWINLGEPAK
jgi:hypothetical protein